MIIKLLASNLTSDLIKNFNNATVKLNLITKDEQAVEFSILNRDTSKSQIEVQLKFQEPKNISQSTELDKV